MKAEFRFLINDIFPTTAMSNAIRKASISVDWVFVIINYFKFLDFHKYLKIQLSAAGKMHIICVLLQNARSFFSW